MLDDKRKVEGGGAEDSCPWVGIIIPCLQVNSQCMVILRRYLIIAHWMCKQLSKGTQRRRPTQRGMVRLLFVLTTYAMSAACVSSLSLSTSQPTPPQPPLLLLLLLMSIELDINFKFVVTRDCRRKRWRRRRLRNFDHLLCCVTDESRRTQPDLGNRIVRSQRKRSARVNSISVRN